MHRAEGTSEVLREVLARIRRRRLEAERIGDGVRVSRFLAMEAVICTGYIPFACPEAIGFAGDAAAAAASGLTEPEWYADAVAACEGDRQETVRLRLAVRLLRATEFWPWHAEAPARPPTHSARSPGLPPQAAGAC